MLHIGMERLGEMFGVTRKLREIFKGWAGLYFGSGVPPALELDFSEGKNV